MKIVGRRKSWRIVGWGRIATLSCLLLCAGIVAHAQSPGGEQPGTEPAEKKDAANPPAPAATPASNSSAGATSGTAGAGPGKQDQADPNAYIIGEQDGLAITVWKEKELSGAVVVRPDGKITVPLVGEIKVVGMTPVQLQTLLGEKLKPFVTVPQVTVAVTEIRSRKVYLIGHAAREGPFMINSSTTVLQIIAQAGGLKDFAKRKKIYILRQNGKEQTRIAFNYDDAIKGKNPEQNILLQPGDTIVVP
jgi:polysaccharide export outer membrane protein